MRPESREEFEVRDLERAILEQKAGKSIKRLIEEGIKVNEFLTNEEETDLLLERQLKKERANPSSDEDDLILNENNEPEFDEEGLSIDY